MLVRLRSEDRSREYNVFSEQNESVSSQIVSNNLQEESQRNYYISWNKRCWNIYNISTWCNRTTLNKHAVLGLNSIIKGWNKQIQNICFILYQYCKNFWGKMPVQLNCWTLHWKVLSEEASSFHITRVSWILDHDWLLVVIVQNHLVRLRVKTRI